MRGYSRTDLAEIVDFERRLSVGLPIPSARKAVDDATSAGRPTDSFADYYRCEEPCEFSIKDEWLSDEGYFTFGNAVCYGRRRGGGISHHVNGRPLPDASRDASVENGRLRLPMDFSEIVGNLRWERYRPSPPHQLERITAGRLVRGLYYRVRPSLPVRLRKHLQKIRLAGWERIGFPSWPVDFTVDHLMQSAMELVLKTGPLRRIPFIWFWPDGAQSCVMMTHDVEGQSGAEFCGALMDLDDAYGIKSSFQIVPTRHTDDLVETIRRRGFDVNIHDWNHDGSLFRDKQHFLQRAALINRYARDLGCRGFRSGMMYREQDWYDAFEFDYDMSVPNVAHLEPQRGGCCTVMPYFIGRILELPLTTVQDYSLFHILGDYSIAIWKTQINLILSQYGLISFIVHPDYVRAQRAQAVYVDLLDYLNRLRCDKKIWVALPHEIDRWWRDRSQMRVVSDGGRSRVEGPGSHRARVAYATLEHNHVVYHFDKAASLHRQ